MEKIRCTKCKTEFTRQDTKNHFTLILACPCCSKRWKWAKVSGVDWKYYPELKEIIMSYKWK